MCTVEQSNSFETKHELDLKNIESRWISLKGPKRLGFFSGYYNEENVKVYCPDESFLGYLDLPNPIFIDCLQGYDPKIKYGHHEIGSSHFLRWVLDNETILKDFPSDFICYNGLLKDMMMSCTCKNDWVAVALKIKGKIIMTRIEAKEKRSEIDEQSEWSNKSTYVAYNLRRLIIKTVNGNESTPLKEGQSCHGVFYSRIGSHRILHAGWLDCVESKHDLNKPSDEIKFVFIKKFQNKLNFGYSFYKANIWWSLATLAGVETIISLNLMLDYIKSIVTEENQYYNFCFNGSDKKLTGYLKNQANGYIIPSWYLDYQLSHKS